VLAKARLKTTCTLRPISNEVADGDEYTMQIWRQALWGSAAAAAVFIAFLSSHGDLGEQRAVLLQGGTQIQNKTASAVPFHSLEADAATRQIAQTVRGLTEDLNNVRTRLGAVERNIDDLTSSVGQQIEANNDASGQALPRWTNDESLTSALAPAVPSNTQSPDSTAFPLPANSAMSASGELPGDASSSASTAAFGADIGSASTRKALLAQWTEMRAAHPRIFESLRPVMIVRDSPRSNRIELRLVVGSFADAANAAKFCATLAASHLSCQPTMLDGQQLALQ
jgi:hypothetical protein